MVGCASCHRGSFRLLIPFLMTSLYAPRRPFRHDQRATRAGLPQRGRGKDQIQGSAYLINQRSWMRRIGTWFRKCSFWRPRRRVTASPASSSSLRCLTIPKRASRAPSDCPSSRNSSSSRSRRVGRRAGGSEGALKEASVQPRIGDQYGRLFWVAGCLNSGFPQDPRNQGPQVSRVTWTQQAVHPAGRPRLLEQALVPVEVAGPPGSARGDRCPPCRTTRSR